MYDSFASYPHNYYNKSDDETGIPATTFTDENLLAKDHLQEQLQPILIISDPSECNNNLSLFMKLIVENVYDRNDESTHNYQKLSSYALKLLTLNLFIKNYELCLGKILGLLSALSRDTSCSLNSEVDEDVRFEIESLREFICIILLLLLKLTNSPGENGEGLKILNLIDRNELYSVLSELGIIPIVANVITNHIVTTNKSKSPFLLLKFGGDIIFEYLYNCELLSDDEFNSLTSETNLIPTIIKHLLANDDFDNYDTEADDWEGENKLFVYEEFKLLLLINEQYLMKSYSSKESKNKVFDGLMMGDVHQTSNKHINGFINLLIYYINREESQIIKILILKFLYLIFTTSYTAKLFYLNDLKILLDIIIRELNDLDYSGNQNGILIVTYLKVLYPLLMFSQLSELPGGYKNEDILEILRNLVLNSESGNREATEISEVAEESQADIIAKLSLRCMSIPWLRKSKVNKKRNHENSNIASNFYGKLSATSSSSSLNSKLSFIGKRSDLYENSDISNESIGKAFTRIASVRTSGRSDYHKHTLVHNENDQVGTNGLKSSYIENNHNIFLDSEFKSLSISTTEDFGNSPWVPISDESNLLDLPKEYLKEEPAQSLKRPESTSSSIKSDSSLAQKASKKKAPPPPLPPKSFLPKPNHINLEKKSQSHTPPPPPPPRRRRLLHLCEQ